MKPSMRVLICLLWFAGSAAHAAGQCADLTKFTSTGHKLVITSAREADGHCRVDGVIDSRVGHGGRKYGIGFAVALPDRWNGRFLFQGGGGLNGSVQPPVGGQFAGDSTALAQGFAVASTDSGHEGVGFDASFFDDQQAALDFLYQGVATVTVIAKEMIARHYGKPSAHSYFVGCSTGGREAMMMSQRFPSYFDGIVAGAPAMRTSFSNLGLRHAATALNAIAPVNADGRPDTRAALSDDDRRLMVDRLLESCDALDGNRDGFIFAARECRFDPAVLECQSGESQHCLTTAKVAAIHEVMQGPRTSSGIQIYPGYYYDTGIANTKGLAGILAAPFIPEGAPAGKTMDLEAAWAAAISGRSMAGDTNAWTNLGTFRAHGGKLIFTHGVSDPWFSARDTVQYYERLGADNSDAPLADWSRLFLVPGMGHCGGGERTLDHFDLLDAIVGWVERGRAPERVIATGASAPGESRPLCPYPAHAQFSGKGDAHDAANYSCED